LSRENIPKPIDAFLSLHFFPSCHRVIAIAILYSSPSDLNILTVS
jgi:hypothetical protein